MEAAQRLLMLQIRVCTLALGSMRVEAGLLTFYSFVKVLVIEIFSSVLGLFGLIIGLLVSSKAPQFDIS